MCGVFASSCGMSTDTPYSSDEPNGDIGEVAGGTETCNDNYTELSGSLDDGEVGSRGGPTVGGANGISGTTNMEHSVSAFNMHIDGSVDLWGFERVADQHDATERVQQAPTPQKRKREPDSIVEGMKILKSGLSEVATAFSAARAAEPNTRDEHILAEVRLLSATIRAQTEAIQNQASALNKLIAVLTKSTN